MPGFIKADNVKIIEPLVANDFCHSMAMGETGCGKTSSFILPNIRKRIKDGHGLFILDYKGSLHGQVKVIAEEEGMLHKIVEIGTTWGKTFNLIKNINKTVFLESVDALMVGDRDRFWSTSSLNFIGTIFDMLITVNHLKCLSQEFKQEFEFNYPFNINSFVVITQSKDSLEKFNNSINSIINYFSENNLISWVNKTNQHSIKIVNQYIKNLQDLYKKLEDFISGIDTDRPANGSGGVLFQSRNLLLTFDNYGVSGECDLLDILNDGNIVLLRCDSYTPQFSISLMHIVYTRLSQRFTLTANPISIVIDEFQRSVTSQTVPFVDVFREKKVELIGAMQNLEQLEIVLGTKQAKAFLGNIVHQYYYKHKEIFVYEKDNKEFKATPVFFEQDVIDKTQINWQTIAIENFDIEKGYVFHLPINEYSYLIRNIKTQELKTNYYLKEEDVVFNEKINEKFSKNTKKVSKSKKETLIKEETSNDNKSEISIKEIEKKEEISKIKEIEKKMLNILLFVTKKTLTELIYDNTNKDINKEHIMIIRETFKDYVEQIKKNIKGGNSSSKKSCITLFKYWKKNTIEIIDDMYKNDDEKRIHYIKVFTTFFDYTI